MDMFHCKFSFVIMLRCLSHFKSLYLNNLLLCFKNKFTYFDVHEHTMHMQSTLTLLSNITFKVYIC